MTIVEEDIHDSQMRALCSFIAEKFPELDEAFGKCIYVAPVLRNKGEVLVWRRPLSEDS